MKIVSRFTIRRELIILLELSSFRLPSVAVMDEEDIMWETRSSFWAGKVLSMLPNFSCRILTVWEILVNHLTEASFKIANYRSKQESAWIICLKNFLTGISIWINLFVFASAPIASRAETLDTCCLSTPLCQTGRRKLSSLIPNDYIACYTCFSYRSSFLSSSLSFDSIIS